MLQQCEVDAFDILLLHFVLLFFWSPHSFQPVWVSQKVHALRQVLAEMPVPMTRQNEAGSGHKKNSLTGCQ